MPYVCRLLLEYGHDVAKEIYPDSLKLYPCRGDNCGGPLRRRRYAVSLRPPASFARVSRKQLSQLSGQRGRRPIRMAIWTRRSFVDAARGSW